MTERQRALIEARSRFFPFALRLRGSGQAPRMLSGLRMTRRDGRRGEEGFCILAEAGFHFAGSVPA